MNKLLRLLLGLVVLAALAFLGFFYWAQQPTWPSDRYAEVVSYAGGTAASHADTFTVVTYNIGYFSGMTNNRPLARTPAFVQANEDAAVYLLDQTGADVVAFQEIDFDAVRSYHIDQLARLAERLAFPAATRAVNWDVRYVPFPYGLPTVHFGQIVSGQGTLSRFPILQHERHVLARPPSPFYYDPFYLERLAEVVVLDVGEPLVLINVHLEAFDQPTRVRQAEAVLALYQRYRDRYPVLLLGDFNSTLPTNTGAAQTDPTTSILLADTTLAEVFPALGQPTDTTTAFTFSAETPRAKIDHIFYHKRRLEPLSAWVVQGGRQPSDHLAVAARFRRLPPE